ncbi:MAG: guanitoxin biosynthesis heme-dependent pre-guanitoxin N-hydroxylase GntA [Ferruginibacter sp.]
MDFSKLQHSQIIDCFHSFLSQQNFPCVAAKNALAKGEIDILIADHIACPAGDKNILQFIYNFVADYRQQQKQFQSAAIIFKEPQDLPEELFETFLWKRLQALRDMDVLNYQYDKRVSNDPESSAFSFSLMEEAFFILALHPGSSRPARRFAYPVLVFNPHAQFEKMKETESYNKMKAIVRKRDISFSGSLNPMLTDFGEISEAFQYSGKNYDATWKCPLKK